MKIRAVKAVVLEPGEHTLIFRTDWEIMEAVDVETETVYGPDGELHPEN